MKRLFGALATIVAFVGAGALFGIGIKFGEETGSKFVDLLKTKYSKGKES